jgi:hypothetical protein
MARLRLIQFATGLITGTTVTSVYTVPTGYKAILKSIQVMEASGVACTVNVRLSGTGTFINIVLPAYPANGSSAHVPCWLVFEPGNVIQLNRSNAGNYTYLLSGSLMLI